MKMFMHNNLNAFRQIWATIGFEDDFQYQFHIKVERCSGVEKPEVTFNASV